MRIRDVPMSRGKNRKSKQPGHYCWACDRRRPNEKFSGRGHARHLCKDCAKLASEELAYRQACRNLERCVTWEGIIPRKRRKSFQGFLNDDDPRIREMAEQIQVEDRATRELLVDRELDEIAPSRVSISLMRTRDRASISMKQLTIDWYAFQMAFDDDSDEFGTCVGVKRRRSLRCIGWAPSTGPIPCE